MIHPVALQGPWDGAWALDVHVVESQFLGYDQYGHPQFDTKRSELGELVYRLKYRGDKAALAPLCEVAIEFIRQKDIVPDILIAVPPSKHRQVQPIMQIAEAITAGLGAAHSHDALTKVRGTDQLKSTDTTQREKMLEGAFRASEEIISGKRILLVDDLYQTGASMRAVAREIRQNGHPTRLNAIALTRTGRR
jgi:predicted amidophosphoribosyltransferase